MSLKTYTFDLRKLAEDIISKKNQHKYSYQDISDRTGLSYTAIRSVTMLVVGKRTAGARAVSVNTAMILVKWVGHDFERYTIESTREFGKAVNE